MRFGQPFALLLLPAVPVLLLIWRYGDSRRRAALLRFAPAAAERSGAAGNSLKRRLVLAAAIALVLALARPQWIGEGARVSARRTGDIVFLLDVSRSMLAGDVAPDRLAHARRLIADLAGQLQGERVALVAFAGNSAIQCPLTLDYAYFRERLDLVSTDSVTRGGTRLGDAINFAAQTAFDDVERGAKSLVILTDGGDQESAPAAAAAAVSMRGIRLVIVGIGDENRGALVPTSESDRMPLLYRGQPVETKLDAASLRALAAANRGAYVDSGLNATLIYRQWLSSRGRPSREAAGSVVDIYPLFLVCAILLLAVEMSMSERRAVVALGLVLALAPIGRSFQDPLPPIAAPPPAPRADVPFELSDWMAAGNEAFRMKNYTEAARNFAIASDVAPRVPEVLFDLATALYRLEQYSEASNDFRKAAEYSHDPRLQAKCKLGQANCSYRMVHGRDAFELAQTLSAVLAQYREARALDASLADVPRNIEVVKRRLDGLKDQLRQASGRYMIQSLDDVKRGHNTDPDDILREGKVPGPLRAGKRTVDRDW